MLKIKHFKSLFFIFILLVFLSSGSFVFALETIYPDLTFLGLPSMVAPKLQDYVSYFFGLGIILAVVLALISMTIGFVQMMYPSPETHKDAVDRVKGSVLGLVLTLSAFIILRTINLSLVTPTTTPLVAGAGIFYYNGQDLKPAAPSGNTSSIPPGFTNIAYRCQTGPALLIWKFPQENLAGYENTVVDRITCGNVSSLSGVASFKVAYEKPGVYYCLGECSNQESCYGYMSEANLASGELPEPFKNNVKSIVTVNDIENFTIYGAILHQQNDPKRGGFCTNPMMAIKERVCTNVKSAETFSAFSADIFVWNHLFSETSGDGIEFYSEPFGWNSGAKAGKCFIGKKEISNFWTMNAGYLLFDYSNVDRPQLYKDLYTTFKIKPGSIRVKGGYLVALYSQSWYCQVFYADVPNLNEMEFVAQKNNIDNVIIIPTR
jgi:hypothetical protein